MFGAKVAFGRPPFVLVRRIVLFQSVDEDAAPAPGHLPIALRAGIVRTLAYRATVTTHFLAPEREVASLAYWT